MPRLDQLSTQLDKLAAFDAGPFPVVSLYLNLQPDQHGRANFEPFLRKELNERLRTFHASGPERESLEQDASRIREYVGQVDGSAHALALFACAAGDLFEAIQLAAPIPEHRLHISDQPHLYPLARLLDEFPRYVVLLADSHWARIFVCAANALQHTEEIEGTKTRHHKVGGWSQARYQRHVENFHLQHAKEVVEALARIVREESIGAIVLAGEDIVPVVREQLPKDLEERVVDIVKLDIRAPEREVLEKTIAALRVKDAETDRERVDALIGAYRGNGLACIGVEDTRRAFEMGQVDELLIPAVPDAIAVDEPESPASTGGTSESAKEHVAGEFVVKARQTSARIRFIEDVSLLEPLGGVGAILRFKI
jgi:peptide chain release factor subunit 1